MCCQADVDMYVMCSRYVDIKINDFVCTFYQYQYLLYVALI